MHPANFSGNVRLLSGWNTGARLRRYGNLVLVASGECDNLVSTRSAEATARAFPMGAYAKPRPRRPQPADRSPDPRPRPPLATPARRQRLKAAGRLRNDDLLSPSRQRVPPGRLRGRQCHYAFLGGIQLSPQAQAAPLDSKKPYGAINP